jgi:hypothetical protein
MKMPAISDKNMSLSPAAQDLGVGAQLQQQLEDQSAEAKKRAAQAAAMNKMGLSGPASQPLGGAATSLGLT